MQHKSPLSEGLDENNKYVLIPAFERVKDIIEQIEKSEGKESFKIYQNSKQAFFQLIDALITTLENQVNLRNTEISDATQAALAPFVSTWCPSYKVLTGRDDKERDEKSFDKFAIRGNFNSLRIFCNNLIAKKKFEFDIDYKNEMNKVNTPDNKFFSQPGKNRM